MSRLIRDWERSSSVEGRASRWPGAGQGNQVRPGRGRRRRALPSTSAPRRAANPRRRDGRTRRQCGGAVQSTGKFRDGHARSRPWTMRRDGAGVRSGSGCRRRDQKYTGHADGASRSPPRGADLAAPCLWRPPWRRPGIGASCRAEGDDGRCAGEPPSPGARPWLRLPGPPVAAPTGPSVSGPSGGRTDPGRIPGPRSPTTVSTRRPQTLVVRPGFCGDDQNAVPSTGLTCQG